MRIKTLGVLVAAAVMAVPAAAFAQAEQEAAAVEHPAEQRLREKTDLLNNALEEIVRLKGENEDFASHNARLTNKNLLLYRAADLLREGRHYEATEELKKIVNEDPQDVRAISFLGILYCELKQFDLAIAQLERQTMLEPQNAKAYANLGFAWLQDGEPKKAAETLEKALLLKPDFAVAHYNLGLSYVELGEREKGLEHFKAAATLFDPLSAWKAAADQKIREYSVLKGE